MLVASLVVEDQEPTLEEVVPQPLGLALGHVPVARLGHVGERVLEQVRVIEVNDNPAVAANVWVEKGDRLEDPHQVRLGPGIVMRPTRLVLSVVVTGHDVGIRVADAREHELATVVPLWTRQRTVVERCYRHRATRGQHQRHGRHRPPPSV